MPAGIYKTRGRAREYCPLACNLYTGCQHGCLYCYVPLYTRTPVIISPVPNILRKLSIQAPGYRNQRVFLCFTCDPYQPLEEKYKLTKAAISIFHKNHITPVILTKAALAQRDFPLMQQAATWFGMTLTFVNKTDSLHWEPNAALPEQRFKTLKTAHEMGIKTWASLEPVIDPEQTLEIIKQTHSFIDFFAVGKLNHHPLAESIDWKKFSHEVTELLQKLNCHYYLKKDLKIHKDTP